MAGCGLSEDTLFSSFFYNYGSSWETPSNQPSGNPRKRQEPARYPEQLQAEPGNSSATFPKSPRAPRPVRPAPTRLPVAPRGCRATSPPRRAVPPPLPSGPEPPLSLKWLQSQVEASPDPRRWGGGGVQTGGSAPDPALPPGRTSTPQTHTLNFDDCAMQSGCIVP
ncbi:uncharacterized protein LOC144341130 [Macaca mulatta]